MIKREKIIIVGAGGLGRGVIDLIKAINNYGERELVLLGFVDDMETDQVNGVTYLGNLDFLLNYSKNVDVIIALGSPRVKREIHEKLSVNEKLDFPNLIHPSVEMSSYNKLGIGNIVSKGVALSTNITIKNFNLIHYNTSVGHDVSIGDYNSIFPLSSISGYVTIGNQVEIGTTTAIIPNKIINDNIIIGAGAVVTDDLPNNITAVGVPAKIIK